MYMHIYIYIHFIYRYNDPEVDRNGMVKCI